MRRTVASALLLLLPCTAPIAPAAREKLKPEELVKRHLDRALAGLERAEFERHVVGACTTTTPAKAAGAIAGPFSFTSSRAGSQLTVQFGTDLYLGESFALQADQVEIGFAQPRTSSRSALGNFLSVHRVIVGEGLMGGVLNFRWPLLDVAARQAKLGYDGLKKLRGRELHRLRYRAKQRQGDLEVHLYFEPDTYRHVASVYTASQSQGIGFSPESSSRESDLHSRMEESFADFEEVGGVTLPKTWIVRYERSGNTTSEWKYEFAVKSIENRKPPARRTSP